MEDKIKAIQKKTTQSQDNIRQRKARQDNMRQRKTRQDNIRQRKTRQDNIRQRKTRQDKHETRHDKPELASCLFWAERVEEHTLCLIGMHAIGTKEVIMPLAQKK